MAGSNRFARLPNEIVDRIALFAVEEVQGVFNERLKRVKVDKTWRDLRAVNRKLRKCVESIVKTPRIIIRAGDKVPDDQAKGLYGPLVRDLPARQVPHVQQSDLSGNYNQLIPFERAIFDTPLDSSKHLYSRGWDRYFCLALPFLSTVTIEIMHPSQLPALTNIAHDPTFFAAFDSYKARS